MSAAENIPFELRAIGVEEVAALLGQAPRTVLEKIACKPGFTVERMWCRREGTKPQHPCGFRRTVGNFWATPLLSSMTASVIGRPDAQRGGLFPPILSARRRAGSSSRRHEDDAVGHRRIVGSGNPYL